MVFPIARAAGVGLLVALSWLSACSADGEGSVRLRVSGERIAIEGLPSDHDHGRGTEEEEIDFIDGWHVEFDTYLVVFGDIELGSTTDGVGASSDALHVVDLHVGEPDIEELGPLPAQRWARVSFRVRAPVAEDDVLVADGVDPADVERLRTGRYNYWIAGHAHHDDSGRDVDFAWGIENPSGNRDCTNGTDETAGLVVRNNSTTEAEITLHIEHLFWDTLGSEQTRLRFEAIAAMADERGQITWEALAGQSLSDLRRADGSPLVDEDGTRVVYNPGSNPIENLQQFIVAATRTQAHLNGAGLCTIEPI